MAFGALLSIGGLLLLSSDPPNIQRVELGDGRVALLSFDDGFGEAPGGGWTIDGASCATLTATSSNRTPGGQAAQTASVAVIAADGERAVRSPYPARLATTAAPGAGRLPVLEVVIGPSTLRVALRPRPGASPDCLQDAARRSERAMRRLFDES